jgi:hypothetical protein
MKRPLGLYVAWLVATVILVFAVTGRHPYGFYTLLRWICCAVFAYSAFAAHEKNRVPWVWIFGVLAVVFNPILPVHLQADRGKDIQKAKRTAEGTTQSEQMDRWQDVAAR